MSRGGSPHLVQPLAPVAEDVPVVNIDSPVDEDAAMAVGVDEPFEDPLARLLDN